MAEKLNLPIGTNRCYCRECGQYFSTVGNFDRHRKDGACLDPANRGLICRDGVWSAIPPDQWPIYAPTNPA